MFWVDYGRRKEALWPQKKGPGGLSEIVGLQNYFLIFFVRAFRQNWDLCRSNHPVLENTLTFASIMITIFKSMSHVMLTFFRRELVNCFSNIINEISFVSSIGQCGGHSVARRARERGGTFSYLQSAFIILLILSSWDISCAESPSGNR